MLTATVLHWLPAEDVRRLYHQLGSLVRPGGLFVQMELMPLVHLPRLAPALADFGERKRLAHDQASEPDWDGWWEQAARDPVLRDAAAQRREVFSTSYPAEEFSPPAEWHIGALNEAGFGEAGVVWRSGPGAILAAVR